MWKEYIAIAIEKSSFSATSLHNKEHMNFTDGLAKTLDSIMIVEIVRKTTAEKSAD
jgi:hypothetical protein